MRRLIVILLLLPALVQAQQLVGPQPGHGYGQNTDGNGELLIHVQTQDVDQGNMNYVSVMVGTSSTQVLGAPTVMARAKLYMVNPSGRLANTTATDVWCAYGVPAVVGQGFMLAGYGDRVTEDVAAVLDQRPINCISTASTTINVGAVQQ